MLGRVVTSLAIALTLPLAVVYNAHAEVTTAVEKMSVCGHDVIPQTYIDAAETNLSTQFTTDDFVLLGCDSSSLILLFCKQADIANVNVSILTAGTPRFEFAGTSQCGYQTYSFTNGSAGSFGALGYTGNRILYGISGAINSPTIETPYSVGSYEIPDQFPVFTNDFGAEQRNPDGTLRYTPPEPEPPATAQFSERDAQIVSFGLATFLSYVIVKQFRILPIA